MKETEIWFLSIIILKIFQSENAEIEATSKIKGLRIKDTIIFLFYCRALRYKALDLSLSDDVCKL